MENKRCLSNSIMPCKQITLAHIIANPDPILYQKLGLNPAVEYAKAAIGVLTVSPALTNTDTTITNKQFIINQLEPK